MAPSRRKYTRKNIDPNPIELIDNVEKLLGEGKTNNILSSPLLTRSIFLSQEDVQTLDDLQFDFKFQHSLFKSKSDSDISQVIVVIPTLLTFAPKKFYSISKKNKHLFWDSLC